MSAPSRNEPNYYEDEIPERDLRILALRAGAFTDVLKWAYALGRVQGQIEGTNEARAMILRSHMEST
jgi:hypothetical protein